MREGGENRRIWSDYRYYRYYKNYRKNKQEIGPYTNNGVRPESLNNPLFLLFYLTMTLFTETWPSWCVLRMMLTPFLVAPSCSPDVE